VEPQPPERRLRDFASPLDHERSCGGREGASRNQEGRTTCSGSSTKSRLSGRSRQLSSSYGGCGRPSRSWRPKRRARDQHWQGRRSACCQTTLALLGRPAKGHTLIPALWSMGAHEHVLAPSARRRNSRPHARSMTCYLPRRARTPAKTSVTADMRAPAPSVAIFAPRRVECAALFWYRQAT
jgi:hypothetical protein